MSETSPSEQLEQEPDVEVKEYSDEYKDQIKDLIFDVYDRERGRPSKSGRPDLDAIKETYQDKNGNFWVAVKEGKVIGTIGLRDQGDERASMHRFCVAKSFRGKEKGVSARLFSTFLEFAEDHDYKKIFLGTGPEATAAIKFYEKNGFVKIESLPGDMPERSYFSHDTVFYELDLEEEK